MNKESFPAALFDGFPEPVLLLRDGTVRYRNPAAERLFPARTADGAVPPELSGLLEEMEAPAMLSGELGGRAWSVSLQAAEGGYLVVLRPAGAENGGPALERLTFRLRQETAGLAAALQRLDPTEEEPDGEKRKKYLAAANRGLYRLLRLANHLEFLDRTDEEVYRPAALDLAGFCRNLCEQVEAVCGLAGVRFTYESELASLVTVGDEQLLRLMILSLVSNAAKAAGEGGGLGLRLIKRRERAVLTVWDRGGGLREGELSRLFGGLDQEPPSLDPDEGLGLGLDAVRRIARLHGGAVMVEGRPGEGLKCVVSLPLRVPETDLGLRSPGVDYAGGFSPLLVELSDVLPARLFLPEDLV